MRKETFTLLMMLLGAITSFSQTATKPSGEGTKSNPYLISNIDNLYWLSQSDTVWDKHFIQTTDINAFETRNWYDGKGFLPIGDSKTPFTGTYNGFAKTIDSLTINRPNADTVGLFGLIDDSKAEVSSLKLRNAVVTGNNVVGILAGINKAGTIEIGSSTGTVTANGDNCGGLVGVNKDTITNSYSEADVNGLLNTGGLIGSLSKGVVQYSFSNGLVSSASHKVGGLIGVATDGTVSNSYSHSKVEESDKSSNEIGGLVGIIQNTTIENCYSTGEIMTNVDHAGLIGDSVNSLVSNSFWDKETSGQSQSSGGYARTTGEMQDPLTYLNRGWDFMDETENGEINRWGYDSTVNRGYPFLKQQGFFNNLPSCSAPVENVDNISFDSVKDTSLIFYGFDSLSYGVEGYVVYINSEDTFSMPENGVTPGVATTWQNNGQQCIYHGTSSNPDIEITNLNPATQYYFQVYSYNQCSGTLLYDTTGKKAMATTLFAVEKPSGSGSENDPYQIASMKNLTWMMLSDTAWDRYYEQTQHIDASVTQSWAGGKGFRPIGNKETAFSGSYKGNLHVIDGLYIKRPNTNLVGLFGLTKGVKGIDSLGVVNAEVRGRNNTGILAGRNNAPISNSYTTGNVRGYYNVGGLGGQNYDLIKNSYSKANVHGSDEVGVFCGINKEGAKIVNSYSIGEASGEKTIAGFCGRNDGKIKRSYTKAQVSAGWGDGYAAGFAFYGNTVNCFYKNQSAAIDDWYATPLSTSEMQTQSIFTDANWDFYCETANGEKEIWKMNPNHNNGFPFLFWENYEHMDKNAPVPDVATLPDITEECSVSIGEFPTATDKCAGKVTATTNDPLAYNNLGTYTITWTYDDGNGNTATQQQTIQVVEDATAPVPDSASLETITSECYASISEKPTATDNCSGKITGTTTDALEYSEEGTYTITWTYEDDNGNTSTQEQQVVIDDVTSPVPDSSSLSDVTGKCSVTVTDYPTASDNCAGAITATTSDALTYDQEGTYTITWKYDDANGNTTTQEQTVVVVDTTKPVPDSESLADVTGECSVTVTETPTATDNCSGTITATTNDELTYTQLGTYTINWTYEDEAGNITQQEQTVVVDDNTAPVPDKAKLDTLKGECEVIVNEVPTASDNCEAEIVGETDDDRDYFAQGTYSITWTYNDLNGNISEQEQIIVVDDTTKPEITCPNDFTYDLTDESTYTVDGEEFDAINRNDNCNLLIPSNNVNNSSTLAGEQFSAGTHTVVWTTKDFAGNEAQCSFDVTINTSVGMESISEAGIRLYPNPAGEKLHIESPQVIIENVEITDLTGKIKVRESALDANEVIDLSALESGVYIVYLQTEEGLVSTKIIKK